MSLLRSFAWLGCPVSISSTRSFKPLCNDAFERILGEPIPAQEEKGASPSQIFDLYLGLNRRREINAKAHAMMQAFWRTATA